MSLALIVATTGAVLIAGALAERAAPRFDVTSTREHALAPRTMRVLGALGGGEGRWEVVFAGPSRGPGSPDRRWRQRVLDVAREMARHAPHLSVTAIDTAADAGLREYERLVQRLVEREGPKIDEQRETILGAADGVERIAAFLQGASGPLDSMASSIPAEGNAESIAYLRQRSTSARVNARRLREIADRARTALADSAPIPDLEGAAALLRATVHELEADLRGLDADLRALAGAGRLSPRERAPAIDIAAQASRWRDHAAIAEDTLSRLARLDLLRISRVLESTSAVLVIGPPGAGLTAIPFDALFASTAAIDAIAGARADVGRNAEELLSTALASLVHPVRPIVMVVHGHSVPLLTRTPEFAQFLDRLAMRGFDIEEWPAGGEADPPSLARLDPAGERPVIHIVLSTDTSAPATAQAGSGAERAGLLGRALTRIVESGGPVMLCLLPSTLPAYGAEDPLAVALPLFGLGADTGRPLLREGLAASGRIVDPSHVAAALPGEHPILSAVAALPTLFEWPVALRRLERPPPGVEVAPLYRIDDRAAWGESQWLGFWQLAPDQRARIPSPPNRDSARDDAGGPWLVAAAASRPFEGSRQRMIVIGSNSWFLSPLSRERAIVDGRSVPVYPGNNELLEASLHWLAGADDLIARTAGARAAPLIRQIDAGTLSAIRWLVVAGLPVLVLALGLAWRIARG